MTLRSAYLRHGILGTLVAAATLAPALEVSALPLDPNDIASIRKERKRAAAKGKLPLPGTPDLKKLDARLARRGFTADSAILIRIFKAESELEVWINRGRGGAYALFATYPICYWSGALGPKLKEGDRQAPEGFYTVTLPQARPGGPRWPQALNIGYPNSFDQLHVRSGSHILIHGGCASIGCFAMTNAVNKELHKLTVRALDTGQAYVHIHAFPFRMTAENLAHFDKHKWHGFWRNLKEGYDLFERSRRPPRISVCNGRYAFAETGELDGAHPGPIAVCPNTQTILSDLRAINARVAERDGPPPSDQAARLALSHTHLGSQHHTNATRHEPNTHQQLAPSKLPTTGVSQSLRRPLLRCSLLLASCRKYAALQEAMAHKEALRLAKPAEKKLKTTRTAGEN